MIEALFKALSAGLTIWQNKDARKYIDKVIKLKKDYYEEYSKPDTFRDDAILDNIEFELCIISEAFNSQIGAENAKAK
jgi:hypothetical protein